MGHRGGHKLTVAPKQMEKPTTKIQTPNSDDESQLSYRSIEPEISNAGNENSELSRSQQNCHNHNCHVMFCCKRSNWIYRVIMMTNCTEMVLFFPNILFFLKNDGRTISHQSPVAISRQSVADESSISRRLVADQSPISHQPMAD